MRYHLTVLLLLLLVIPPVMTVLAAPVPAPSAILDIGPPPKGKTAEEHAKEEIGRMDFGHGMLNDVWCTPEIRKMPSVARFKDARPWLAENIRIKPEKEGRHLRLTFRAGTRDEQVAILNELMRVNLRAEKTRIKFFEDCIRTHEKRALDLEDCIESGRERDPRYVAKYRKTIDELRSTRIPECRAEIDRMKQVTVIKWAK